MSAQSEKKTNFKGNYFLRFNRFKIGKLIYIIRYTRIQGQSRQHTYHNKYRHRQYTYDSKMIQSQITQMRQKNVR